MPPIAHVANITCAHNAATMNQSSAPKALTIRARAYTRKTTDMKAKETNVEHTCEH
jgi:hypothetical protein